MKKSLFVVMALAALMIMSTAALASAGRTVVYNDDGTRTVAQYRTIYPKYTRYADQEVMLYKSYTYGSRLYRREAGKIVDISCDSTGHCTGYKIASVQEHNWGRFSRSALNEDVSFDMPVNKIPYTWYN